MNKKKYLFIGLLTCLLIIIVLFVCLTKNTNKQYDIEAIKSDILRYYDEIRIMDFMDMTTLFGTDLTELDEATFLSNINLEDYVTPETVMICIINTNNEVYYYDIFQSFVDSNLLNIEETELLDLFSKSILKKGDGYVYFIFGKEAKIIESEINVHYK